MTIPIILIVLALVCMFSIPLMIHFIGRTDDLEQYISEMNCSHCKYCKRREFHTESGTEVNYQCYDTKANTWTDTEPNKLCERYIARQTTESTETHH